MTALELLGLIVAALLLQLMAGIGVSVMRRRAAAALAPPPTGIEVPPPSKSAWTGLREFRVVQRAFEDAAQSQCSFHLQPVDGQPLPAFKPPRAGRLLCGLAGLVAWPRHRDYAGAVAVFRPGSGARAAAGCVALWGWRATICRDPNYIQWRKAWRIRGRGLAPSPG